MCSCRVLCYARLNRFLLIPSTSIAYPTWTWYRMGKLMGEKSIWRSRGTPTIPSMWKLTRHFPAHRAVSATLSHFVSSTTMTFTRHHDDPHPLYDYDYTIHRDASPHHHVAEASRQGRILKPR